MNYQLVWGGRLWTVAIPYDELDTEIDRWTYAQTFVSSGGSAEIAMRRVLGRRFPGIGWDGSTGQPRGYDSVVFGSVPCVPSSRDTSSPVASFRNRSQKHPESSVDQQEKHVALDSAAPRRHYAPRSTSTGGPHGVPASAAPRRYAGSQRSMPVAIPHTGGWMGSASTTPPAKGGVPRAS